jgi:hypothetical protein
MSPRATTMSPRARPTIAHVNRGRGDPAGNRYRRACVIPLTDHGHGTDRHNG